MDGHSRFANEVADMHPRSWLVKYRETSIWYLTKMGLFYHAIGAVLAVIGTLAIEHIIPGYEEPIVPFSLIDGLAAGPIEETFFFGIPLYAIGNHYLVLAAGIFWASLHVLNTNIPEIGNLAYGNFFFATTHLFFSLRTWISGKGWFAIIFHSAWNGMAFSLACGIGELPCAVVGSGFDFFVALGSIILSAILLGITYWLYHRRHSKEKSPVT